MLSVFTWVVECSLCSFVAACAGSHRGCAHKGPSLRCPRAPLSAPQCSPTPPWPLASGTTLPPTECHLPAITGGSPVSDIKKKPTFWCHSPIYLNHCTHFFYLPDSPPYFQSTIVQVKTTLTHAQTIQNHERQVSPENYFLDLFPLRDWGGHLPWP